ncbi:hypothetical protein [Alkalihalobacillus sp. BA299]|uniref:hypothetical protein n=1 Tax=Alkalihalobacillus sp. BA299 TaxID=2815938 RepID=UPI001AD9D246|nr:hypothetical protein [Alkalihalobacillus sp. BA299]
MKWMDWFIVILLLFIGLSCLSMSMTLTTDENSMYMFIVSLVKICLWVAVPSLLLGVFYLWIKKKKRD